MLFAILPFCSAAPQADLVNVSLPGFPASPYPFKFYSGFLEVKAPTPVAGYDGWVIHYQFHESQRTPSTDPVFAWHTGGPGGSSIYGQYAETGYFQVSDSGQRVNPYAWNRVANSLYLEAPAGSFLTPSDQRSGFSYCLIGGKRQRTCSWNDQTQAQAYALTLAAFFAKFPEYGKADLYLVGESYAGQYIPNIAHHLLDPSVAHLGLGARLKGIAVGNGCWGGDANNVMCNGPNEDRDLMAMYFGKGLLSYEMYSKLQSVCKFPDLPVTSGSSAKLSLECDLLLAKADLAVGPHNVYNVYDNCPGATAWYEASGKSPRWLSKYLRKNAHDEAAVSSLSDMGGGYDWTCGTFAALPAYFKRDDVRAALHLPSEQGSIFQYDSSGPASITLYPELIKKIRVLIYNGDADSCVPYVGNELWVAGLAGMGYATEAKAWHPWYAQEKHIVAGYATSYNVEGANISQPSFAFATIKLSGHEAPHYAPAQSFDMFSRFLANTPW